MIDTTNVPALRDRVKGKTIVHLEVVPESGTTVLTFQDRTCLFLDGVTNIDYTVPVECAHWPRECQP